MTARRHRLAMALGTWPTQSGWIAVLRATLVGLPLLVFIAWLGQLVRFDPVMFGLGWVRVAASLAFVPAFGEELFFRVLLVPAPWQRMTAAAAVFRVAIFVAWHPFQALTIGPPWSGAFLDPWFLAVVAVLGALLVHVYRVTGSIWPCVALHWVTVVLWKLVLGGPF